MPYVAFCVTGSEDGFLRLGPLDFSGVFLEVGTCTVHVHGSNTCLSVDVIISGRGGGCPSPSRIFISWVFETTWLTLRLLYYNFTKYQCMEKAQRNRQTQKIHLCGLLQY